MSPVIDDLGELRPDQVPATAEEFLASLHRPTCFRLVGRDRSRCRAVAGLLHGNEPSGLRALHALARRARPPAVDVVGFIGGVAAASQPPGLAHRMLPGRRDLNRCFRPPFDDDDGRIAEAALACFAEAQPEALVDLHNNTGANPAYAVGPGLEPARLALAAMFSPLYVHSAIRLGSLMEAFSDFPTVTVECGRAGDAAADRFAEAALARFVDADALPTAPAAFAQTILQNPFRLCLRPGLRLAFAEQAVAGADLTLAADVDRHNFRTLEAGHAIGWVAGADWPLEARDEAGRDRSRDYFAITDGRLVTRTAFIPIMVTTDATVALSDCLFYVVPD